MDEMERGYLSDPLAGDFTAKVVRVEKDDDGAQLVCVPAQWPVARAAHYLERAKKTLFSRRSSFTPVKLPFLQLEVWLHCPLSGC